MKWKENNEIKTRVKEDVKKGRVGGELREEMAHTLRTAHVPPAPALCRGQK
jgi:hypothetical protein